MKRSLSDLITFLVLTALMQASCTSAITVAPTATSATPVSRSRPSSIAPTVPAETPNSAQPILGPLYVVINPPIDESIDLQNSFIQTSNSLGANANKYDDLFDTKLDIRLVNDAIKAGAKGIAIQVFSPVTGLGPTIAKAAKTASVVLIAIEIPLKDANGKPVPLIRFDDKEMGKNVGEAALKLLNESGWLKDSAKKVGVLSLEVKRQPFCNLRTDNEKAVIKAAGVPNNQIFPLQYDNIMIDSQNKTEKILRAHPDITNWVIFGCDDHGVAGSLKALAAAGVRTVDIIAIGLGTSEACILWTAGLPTGFKAALNISYQDIGKTTAAILNDAVVNGKTPAALTIVATTIVDDTNFKTIMDPVALNRCGK